MTIIAWRENWGHRVDMSITRRERKRKGIIETYSTLFDCMDDAIVQESKVVVKNENATTKRNLMSRV